MTLKITRAKEWDIHEDGFNKARIGFSDYKMEKIFIDVYEGFLTMKLEDLELIVVQMRMAKDNASSLSAVDKVLMKKSELPLGDWRMDLDTKKNVKAFQESEDYAKMYEREVSDHG